MSLTGVSKYNEEVLNATVKLVNDGDEKAWEKEMVRISESLVNPLNNVTVSVSDLCRFRF
ncbi:hypothetical protein CHOTACABRAS_21 [Bacillus phage Chotacabras]|nr:hypothetical protein CHOTACABRAS_21 [Bacillus phage Chotacabras]